MSLEPIAIRDGLESITIEDENGNTEVVCRYSPKLISRATLKKNIFIPQGSILSGGLVEIECVSPFLELVIGIGKDHTARLIISEAALYELNKIEPETTIF